MTYHTPNTRRRAPSGGYTLIELMVSIGLFAIIMTLVAGAYFMIINLSRQAQAISTAVDGVSYALEDMSRTMRTGTLYGCPTAGIDCPAGGTVFTLTDQSGITQTFSLSGTTLYQKSGTGSSIALTDPSIKVSSLEFYAVGTKPASAGDYVPPHVTVIVSGSIVAGKQTFPFTIETGATMRGVDL
jgi:prepilin-type N-terminal cleavage/methylation domain-containing protein